MNYLHKIPVLIILVFFVLISCGDNTEKKATGEQWIEDELLQQLAELREDVNGLRADVVKLQKSNSQRPTIKKAFIPTKVKLDSNIEIGNANAKIAIVEFTDYQCPFCGRYAKQVYPFIKKNYIDMGKVRYVVYDYPLSFHNQAMSAAVSAHCAASQNKYPAMRDALFDNYNQLSNQKYLQLAQDLSLNITVFTACLKNGEINKKIENNIKYGTSLGVSGTPKFFIGNVSGDEISNIIVVSGAQPYAKFDQAIKKLMANSVAILKND